MGVHPNITSEKFPRQSDTYPAGTRCRVIFHYDTDNPIGGTIRRDDMEDPWIGIIELDDGRFILMTECQWSPDHG